MYVLYDLINFMYCLHDGAFHADKGENPLDPPFHLKAKEKTTIYIVRDHNMDTPWNHDHT